MIVLLVAIEMKIISNASGYETREKVVVAARDIGEGTVIAAVMLEVREISSSAVHRDAVRRIEDAVGMRAADPIYNGEMLLRGRLTQEEDDKVKVLNRSNRLFCLAPGWDQANAWQLEKDQHVDIIFVPNHLDQGKACPEASGVISVNPPQAGIKMMKNIRIAGLVDEDGKTVNDSGAGTTPKYVIFEVTQDQAVFLAYAKSNGRIEISAVP